MAASPTEIQPQPHFAEQVETRMLEIERLADADNWDSIESILVRIPALIERIPDSERRDILLATQSRVERIRERAAAKSEEITGQLATLKTGRRAVASYQATEGIAIDFLDA